MTIQDIVFCRSTPHKRPCFTGTQPSRPLNNFQEDFGKKIPVRDVAIKGRLRILVASRNKFQAGVGITFHSLNLFPDQ